MKPSFIDLYIAHKLSVIRSLVQYRLQYEISTEFFIVSFSFLYIKINIKSTITA